MKYKFLKLDGSIFETDKLDTIKKNLTWKGLNYLTPDYPFNKTEGDFMRKYGLTLSVWNCAVLHELKMVYLFESDYKRLLKGGLK